MLAELDARGLHRQRVSADIAQGIDAAIGRRIAGAANAGWAQCGVESHGLVRIDPADVQAGTSLHRHAFATRSLFVFRCGEDEVTEFAKARVGAKEIRLAPVKVDAPPAKGDRGRCPALRADHAGCTTARAIADPSPIDHDDPFRT